jgi:LysM repeat protein
MCDACAISMVKTQLEMPLASNTDISRGFASITASCKTAVSVTPPKTTLQWVVSATTTTGTTRTTTSSTTGTPGACQGKTYTIQSGDTCTSVSLSQRIGTTQLLAANNLRADCASFPQSGTVCIPSSATCEPHKVSFQNPRESCADLARAANATMLQLVAWNPELGTDCANINRQTAGYTVCLSPPGGSWSDPHPNSTASATTTSIEYVSRCPCPPSLSTCASSFLLTV